MNENVEVVVAHYEENLDWIPEDWNVKVYSKGNNKVGTVLPNVGREAHTYLYHIVTNWDVLADYTFFIQGRPFDHSPDIKHHVDNFKPISYREFSKFVPTGLGDGKPHHPGLKIDETCERFFGYKKKEYPFASGAQFVVSKERIMKRPKSFYEELLDYSEHGVEAAWVLERLWREVFHE